MGATGSLSSFHKRFTANFHTKTRDVSDISKRYLLGLFQTPKKNMERMAEVVPDSNDQAFQHFLSKSPWDENNLMDQVAHDANGLIGGHKESCLIIDESSIPKKGSKSVGVDRQYCGERGKVDNCQVGVFAALGYQKYVIPVDCRLYLPRSWAEDRLRCQAAGVPDDFIEYQRKQDLALQIIIAARGRGLCYGWIGCDGFYGEDGSFLRYLDDMGETFVADVHRDQRIYLTDPKPYVPEPRSKRGRKPIRLKSVNAPVRVDSWVFKQPAKAWKRVHLRKTSKGKLKVDILYRRIFLWDGDEAKPHCWHLIVRRDIDGKKIKYSLSNASVNTPLERLAYMQCQRYLIERVFEEGKNQCGMGDYQARGWRSWHHHMAMVILAMLFMAETRYNNKSFYPLLSGADVVAVLKEILPRRTVSKEEIFRQLEERHRRRQVAIDSAYRKQYEKERLTPFRRM